MSDTEMKDEMSEAEVQVLWAQKTEEGSVYNLAGVDLDGELSVVWTLENAARMGSVLQSMKILAEKHHENPKQQWVKDLTVCVNFMKFMVPRTLEAAAIFEKRNQLLEQKTDSVITKNELTSPYCMDLHILSPQHHLWRSFSSRLKGPEGINFSISSDKATWYCVHTYDKTRAIIEKYYQEEGIDIDATLEFFEANGGTCDCTILFNVIEKFFSRNK